jgi:CHAD domain-containing protein
VSSSSDLTVADVLRRCVQTATERLLAHEAGLVLGEDPEAVHQARVATRRLRSDLHTFRAYVDHDWALELRAELQWLGGELGAVRDLEVLRDRLRAHAGLLPRTEADAASRAIRRIDADREAARAEMLAELKTPRYADLRASMISASTHPPVTRRAAERAVEELARVVRAPWKKLRRAADRLGDTPSDEELHAVRIRAKRCRYAAEATAIAFGKPAKRFAAAMADVQDVLGEHQDAVVARQWLTKTAPECAPGEAYALGMLTEVERRSAAAARSAFPEIWERAARPRLRRWL